MEIPGRILLRAWRERKLPDHFMLSSESHLFGSPTALPTGRVQRWVWGRSAECPMASSLCSPMGCFQEHPCVGTGSHQGDACPWVVVMPGEGGDAGAGRGATAGRRAWRTAERSVTHQAAGTRAQHRCSRQTAVGQRGGGCYCQNANE